MRFWFDTEFIDRGRAGIGLLSIGIVAEDNRTYYAEVADESTADANDFVTANVLPYLGDPHGRHSRTRSEIATEIVGFVGGRPDWWAWYGAYDWVALSNLYGPLTGRPQDWGFASRDVLELTHLAWADDGEAHVPSEVEIANGHGLTVPAGAHHALGGAYFARALWTCAQYQARRDWGSVLLGQLGCDL